MPDATAIPFGFFPTAPPFHPIRFAGVEGEAIGSMPRTGDWSHGGAVEKAGSMTGLLSWICPETRQGGIPTKNSTEPARWLPSGPTLSEGREKTGTSVLSVIASSCPVSGCDACPFLSVLSLSLPHSDKSQKH